MNDFCLGIAWFCFVEVKNPRITSFFCYFFFNFSPEAEDVLNLFLIFWEIEAQCSYKVCLIKKV